MIPIYRIIVRIRLTHICLTSVVPVSVNERFFLSVFVLTLL